MSLQIDEIKRLAERVAASHHLEVVEVEFSGGPKSRVLRVFLEKDAAERKRLRERVAAAGNEGQAGSAELAEQAELAELAELPRGVPVELLSGITHEDCAAFATDFGTLLDVEDAVPGGEYTLEVSSPGLERRLVRAEDFVRFQGSLVKLKTFTPVNQSRLWVGRLAGFTDGVLQIDLPTGKQKRDASKRKRDTGKWKRDTGKQKWDAGEPAVAQTVEIQLSNVEKANLVVEI